MSTTKTALEAFSWLVFSKYKGIENVSFFIFIKLKCYKAKTMASPHSGIPQCITFTFSHFADAFIQSDIQLGNT